MVDQISSAGIQSLSRLNTSGSSIKPNENSGFSELVKGIAQDTIQSSRAADSASESATIGQISDLELVQVMNEAELSLQRFKTVYESTKQSLDKILNMNI